MNHDQYRPRSSEEALLARGIRALRDELIDSARMHRLEAGLRPVFAEAPRPPWTRRVHLVLAGAGLIAGVALSTRSVMESQEKLVADAPTSVVHADAPSSGDDTSTAGTPSTSVVPTVSIDALSDVPREEHAPLIRVPRAPEATVATTRCDARELALLEAARAALGTDPAKTLALTAEHVRKFRAPCFLEEREALTIEALGRLDRHDDAVRHVTAFDATHKGSVHHIRIHALVDR